MKPIILTFVMLVFTPRLTAQIYFPLHVGDYWSFGTSDYVCEGTSIISGIRSDTVSNGHTYYSMNAMFSKGRLFRSDSMRVYRYDPVTNTEITIFNFASMPGDTVSVSDSGTSVIIAMGSLRFLHIDTLTHKQSQISIQDSFGVYYIYTWNVPCPNLYCSSAYINGAYRRLSDVENSVPEVPTEPTLSQNYPNPFNPSTTIIYEIPNLSHVRIEIFNLLGLSVALLENSVQSRGSHTLNFDGSPYASGFYFCRLTTTPAYNEPASLHFTSTIKMILLK